LTYVAVVDVVVDDVVVVAVVDVVAVVVVVAQTDLKILYFFFCAFLKDNLDRFSFPYFIHA
jgi:hypothetical protein